MYYERTGSGRPLVLLHGNGEDHKIFDSFLPLVKDEFTVYALDSRSHGQSSRAKLDYREMARDVEGFIEASGLVKPVVAGFSDGGIVALMLAAAGRADILAIAAFGANSKPEGIKRRWRFLFKLGYFFTHSEYLKLMIEEPHISSEELKAIKVPALITVGERDMIYPEHVKSIADGISGAEFVEVPGEGHASYVTDGKKLYSVAGEFLGRMNDRYERATRN